MFCQPVILQFLIAAISFVNDCKELKLEKNCINWPVLLIFEPNWFINPFAPGNFAKKRILKLVEQFSGHCRAIKS